MLWVQNPFGAAKPRESVLATRLGKDELAVLQEDLKKDRMNVRSSSVHVLAAGSECTVVTLEL